MLKQYFDKNNHLTKRAYDLLKSIKASRMSIDKCFIKDAIRYLDISGVKNKFIEQFSDILERNEKENFPGDLFPRKFSLELDIIILSDISMPLVQLVVNDMESAEKIFFGAFKRIIEALHVTETPLSNYAPNIEPKIIDIHELFHLTVQLRRIPRALFNNSINVFNHQATGRLIFFRGIAISITPLSRHKRVRKYPCLKSCSYENNEWEESTGWSSTAPNSSSCPLTPMAFSTEKIVDEMIEAVFTPTTPFYFRSKSSHRLFDIRRGILVRFYDDLASDIRLGKEYEIAALKTKEGMKGYHIQKTMLALRLNSFTNLKVCSILSLKEKMVSSPWAFFIALASQMSFGFYPDSSFLNLKQGLLLSLVSLGSSRCPIPIFALGPEFIPAHRLMLHASKLVSRTVIHSANQLVTGRVKWQEEQFGKSSVWIDAGSLILAQGGVCYMGNWARYKNEAQSAIVSAIEKREIFIPACKTVPVSDFSFPLKSAVWLHGNIKKADKLRPLIDIFGIPFIVKLDSQEEDRVIDLILQNSCNNSMKPNNFRIKAEELKMFLQITRSIEVSLSPEAAQLIQDYFVASRRCRGVADSGECLPIRAVDVITQMSEAHARLHLRSSVTLEDALVAIYVCEEAISAIYGKTSMSAPPPLRIKETSWANFIREVDCYMKQFEHWLRRFIRDLIGESSLTREE